MSARLINGKKIAEEIENELKAKVSKMDTPPKLSVIQVGDDPASISYIKAKSNAAKRVGIELIHHHLSILHSHQLLHFVQFNFNTGAIALCRYSLSNYQFRYLAIVMV